MTAPCFVKPTGASANPFSYHLVGRTSPCDGCGRKTNRDKREWWRFNNYHGLTASLCHKCSDLIQDPDQFFLMLLKVGK